jgi:hypothetical protein
MLNKSEADELADLITAARKWFENEVEAGDVLLDLWVSKMLRAEALAELAYVETE